MPSKKPSRGRRPAKPDPEIEAIARLAAVAIARDEAKARERRAQRAKPALRAKPVRRAARAARDGEGGSADPEWGRFMSPHSGNVATADEVLPPLAKAWTLTTGGRYNDGFAVADAGRIAVAAQATDVLIVEPDTGRVLHELRDVRRSEGDFACVGGRVFTPYAYDLDTGGVAGVVDLATGRLRTRRGLRGIVGGFERAGRVVVASVDADVALPGLTLDRTGYRSGVVEAGVLHGHDDRAPKRLVAIDLRSRRLRWRAPAGDGSEKALAVGEGVVLSRVGRGDAVIRARDAATGRQRWQVATRRTYWPPFAIRDGRVTYADGFALLCRRLTDGRELWRREVARAMGSPLATGGVLWCTLQQDRASAPELAALDPATGATRWSMPLRGDVSGVRLMHVGGGRLLLRLGRTLVCLRSAAAGG